MGYYCLAKKGTLPPRVEHATLEEAKTEALRLYQRGAGDIQILQKIGEVKTEKVLVTSIFGMDTFNRLNKGCKI
jgi:hypothetical protein